VSGDFAKKFKERVKVRKEKRGEAGRVSMVARADFVFLCRAAMGEIGGGDGGGGGEELEKQRMGEVLQRMKGIVRSHLEKTK